MSPEIINELILIMGQPISRTLLSNIKKVTSNWFGIIADEAKDVACREQLNLSIRWVNNHEVSEDRVGLLNTTADTTTRVTRDLLVWCDLALSLYRGQAYDGAATMQGRRKGVATQTRASRSFCLFLWTLPKSLPTGCEKANLFTKGCS